MNILQSIWNYKCPRCRKGNLFISPFDIKNPLNMHETCDHCQQRFMPEPGYYFGAMFISYIWTVMLCLGIVSICMFLLGWSIEASFALLIFISAVCYFWIARISRAMYIHLDVRFNKDLAEKNTAV